MSMNTYIRLYEIYNDEKYGVTLGQLFDYASVTEHFWNATSGLWYRDGGFLKTDVYWSRGNGWALGALVDTIRLSKPTSPDYQTYVQIFKQNVARLKSLQGSDGCWRSSLTDPVGYPTPETTGSSLFCYGIAWGINSGILDKNEYLETVEKSWQCISQMALHPNGLFGYCQPVGAQPERNITPNSTSDFCVGQFIMASVEVAVLAKSPLN